MFRKDKVKIGVSELLVIDWIGLSYFLLEFGITLFYCVGNICWRISETWEDKKPIKRSIYGVI